MACFRRGLQQCDDASGLQRVDESHDNSHSAGSDGVALGSLETELLHHRHEHHGEGLVALEQIDVAHSQTERGGEKLEDGFDGRSREPPLGLVRVEDMSDRILSCSIRPLLDAQQQTVGALVVFTDVSARKAAQRLRQRQEQVLELIAGGAPLPEVLSAVAGLVEVHAGGGLGSVMLVQGSQLRLAAAPSLPPALRQKLDGLPIGEKGGACGMAVQRREMVTVVDIVTDPLMVDYRELAAQYGLHACWSMPVLSGSGEVLATFAIYHHEVRRPGPQALVLIETAARLVRIAIERDRAAQAVLASESRFRELADTIDDVFYVRDLAGGTLSYV
eukprot:gene34026-41961_t